MEKLNNNFVEMTNIELEETSGGNPALAIAIASLVVAGYGLLRNAVKEQGYHDGYYGK